MAKTKNVFVILTLVLISVLTLSLFGCNKKKANASTITSDVPLIELPAIPFTDLTTMDGGYIPSIYLGYSNNSFIFYYAIPNDSLANFDYNIPTLLPTNTAVTFSPNYVYIDISNNISIKPLHIGGGSTITISDVSYEYLAQTCAYIGYEFINTTLTYYMFNSNRNVIATITLNNVYLQDNFTMADYDYYIFTTISSSANTTDLVNLAYRQGYDVGYNDGYTKGIQVTNGSPLGIIANSVDAFLDINLFGDFKISTLLYISFGMILVGIVIKVFLGG